MKKLTLLFFYVALNNSLWAQTWQGSTTTSGLAYRDGNVVIGHNAFEGSYGNDRVLQMKGEGTWLSMVSTINGGGSFNIGFAAGVHCGFYSRTSPISFWTSPTSAGGLAERLRITTSGDVGIGTALTNNPNGYKLAVNGKIGAKEIQVENTSGAWADYVFEPTYQLRSLIEVEQFIKANKHLPEIPSKKEIEENGHKLGEMDVLLLKKIEEMTLYILDQEKRIKQLEQQITTLSKN
jgi:hypothetical protein